MGTALQLMNQHAEPFAFMIQCPKCLWWSNSPRWHASTCQFRDIDYPPKDQPAPSEG